MRLKKKVNKSRKFTQNPENIPEILKKFNSEKYKNY